MKRFSLDLNSLFRDQCDLDRKQLGVFVPDWLTNGTRKVPNLKGNGWIQLEVDEEPIEHNEDHRLDDPRHVPYSNLGRR